MKDRFEKVINSLRGKIPEQQLTSFSDIFKDSDPKIAIECVCTQIDELEVKISQEQYEELNALCSLAGVEDSYLQDLKPHVIDI